MSNLRQVFPVSLAILIALNTVACGAASPAVTSTPGLPTAEGNIDVGGYKLLYQCFGQGSPAVIIEAGAGDKPVTSLTWQPVTQEVQTTTRICVYNRASGVPTSRDIAEDLHALLSKIPLDGPYILVGHSLGGYHVRVYTQMYPEDVAGIILVDTTVAEGAVAYATAYPTYSPNETQGVTLNRISDISALPTPDFDGLDFNTSTEQVRQAGSLGDLPLIVISANPDPDQFAIPGLTLEDQERMAATMLKLQSDLANLSSKGVFMIANTSKHFISLNDPQIIIDAITQMAEEIRNH